jgi:hypothetical protein
VREQVIQQQIRLDIGINPEVRLFRNNCGVATDQRTGNFIRYGLAVGSSDLIGIRKVTITPDMVGQTIGVFASLEVKTDTGKPSTDQKKWLSMVQAFGGIAGVVRSPQDARSLLQLP